MVATERVGDLAVATTILTELTRLASAVTLARARRVGCCEGVLIVPVAITLTLYHHGVARGRQAGRQLTQRRHGRASEEEHRT